MQHGRVLIYVFQRQNLASDHQVLMNVKFAAYILKLQGSVAVQN